MNRPSEGGFQQSGIPKPARPTKRREAFFMQQQERPGVNPDRRHSLGQDLEGVTVSLHEGASGLHLSGNSGIERCEQETLRCLHDMQQISSRNLHSCEHFLRDH
jgi:hypothetical protein